MTQNDKNNSAKWFGETSSIDNQPHNSGGNFQPSMEGFVILNVDSYYGNTQTIIFFCTLLLYPQR